MTRFAAIPRILCLTIALIFGDRASPSRATEPTFAGPAQGTTYRVRLGQPLAVAELAGLRAEIESLLADVDHQMSRYHADTEVSRFNRSASTDWFAVSSDLAAVVRAAISIHDQSGGTFDITVAPLVDAWGFGPRGGAGRIPSADEIARIRESVGSELLAVRAGPPALRKLRGGVALDLNGIAPGFAVDRIAQCLERHGVLNYLIRLDGHIRTRGHALDGRPWRVGIDRPTEIPSGVQLAIEMGDGSLSTSGDYRHYFMHEGHRYSHIIDPRTGWPIAHAATSVSIVADDCLTADAWAKALMVLGPVDGLRLANERGIAAYYVIRAAGDSAGAEFAAVPTERFARRFLDTSIVENEQGVVPSGAHLAAAPSSSLCAPSDETHTIVARLIIALIAFALSISAIVVGRRWAGPTMPKEAAAGIRRRLH
jgi:thiamine biosynthesis lipoprotein